MSDQVPRPSDRLRRMASEFEKAVSETRAEQLAARAIARALPNPHAQRRLVVVVTVVALALVVGLGITSADTLPGDSLYPVSRAYEEIAQRVGAVNSVERRLNEVIALAERGETDLAVNAAREALVELGYDPSPQPSLTPTTSTTEPEESQGSQVRPTTPTTSPPEVTVEATPETDQVDNLRLAAAALLSNVQENGGDLEAATADLAKALADVTVEEPETGEETTTTTIPPSTTTSTTVVDSTTTTVVEETTTTVPDSTTTTLPEEEEGPGPIFLPPSP